jgi:hypothetical protein
MPPMGIAALNPSYKPAIPPLAFSAPMESERAPEFCFDAFSLREAVSTSLETRQAIFRTAEPCSQAAAGNLTPIVHS